MREVRLTPDAATRPLDLGKVELLERSVLAAAAAATLCALALVARNRVAPVQTPLTFGLVFWAGFALLYASALTPLVALAAAFGRRVPALRRMLVAAVALGFLAVATASNQGALKPLLTQPGPERARGLGLASVVFSVAALIWLALARPGRRRGYRLLSAGALAAALGALWPEARPLRLPAGVAGAPRIHKPPLVVIGIDGADWRLLDPLLERDELPRLRALRERGAFGPLKTLTPTISPPIWTTIATGRSPRAHGIRDFTIQRLLGVEEPLLRFQPLRNVGFAALMSSFEATGLVQRGLITSAARRVPAFWNIASFYRSPIAVVGWWATWPAEPILGFVVSERAYYEELAARRKRTLLPPGLAHPAGLMDELRGRILLPDQVTIEDVRPFVPELTDAVFQTMQVRHPSPLKGIRYELTYDISVFRTSHRLALDLIERGRSFFAAPPDLFVLYKIVDGTCHTALKHSELIAPTRTLDDEDRLFRHVVTGAYRAADAAVGELLDAVGEANVVVVSDHGFDSEGGRYHHERDPDGILIASGPAFRPGRIEGLRVLDVMPLLLQAKGLPLAEDLEGQLPREAFWPEFLESVPVRSVSSYGRWGAPQAVQGTAEAEATAIERLRALGYIR